MSKKIAIAGYSGHAYVVIDALLANGLEVVGYLDMAEAVNNPFNLSFLGSETDVATLALLKQNNIAVALGIGSNAVRKKIFNTLASAAVEIISVIHPKSTISSFSSIGKGCFVAAGAVVQTFAQVKEGSIINTGAIVEHECEIGSYCHIAPGAVLAGNVIVGNHSLFGAAAVAKQGVFIGERCVIGAGAVVVSNVPDNEVWVGVPAKKLINHD